MNIKRGSIYWIDLSPSLGSEIDKIRPCLIISNDINNEYSRTVTVIPITSKVFKVYPFEVLILKGILEKDSKAKTDQIRTIDKSRLREKIGDIADSLLIQIEKALMIHLGIS